MEAVESKIGVATDLVFLENTPFLATFKLATLAVLPPLHSIAHGRHGGSEVVGCDELTNRK